MSRGSGVVFEVADDPRAQGFKHALGIGIHAQHKYFSPKQHLPQHGQPFDTRAAGQADIGEYKRRQHEQVGQPGHKLLVRSRTQHAANLRLRVEVLAERITDGRLVFDDTENNHGVKVGAVGIRRYSIKM